MKHIGFLAILAIASFPCVLVIAIQPPRERSIEIPGDSLQVPQNRDAIGIHPGRGAEMVEWGLVADAANRNPCDPTIQNGCTNLHLERMFSPLFALNTVPQGGEAGASAVGEMIIPIAKMLLSVWCQHCHVCDDPLKCKGSRG